MKIQAIIEMPQGCYLKYEKDKFGEGLYLDRILNQSIPYNYGFVPNTLCDDGDPLDIFVLTDGPIYPLTKLSVKIVGALKCLDNGIQDDKLLSVIEGDIYCPVDSRTGIITAYLESYKKGFVVQSFVGQSEAINLYENSIKLHGEALLDSMKSLGHYINDQINLK